MIVIIGGVMKVGLSKEEIELLGCEGYNVIKVSCCDLFFVVVVGKNGVIIVVLMMIIAVFVGIKVFVIGGIGGVYCGVEYIFDIFVDL